jgi:hypothetical protein
MAIIMAYMICATVLAVYQKTVTVIKPDGVNAMELDKHQYGQENVRRRQTRFLVV